MRYDKIMLTAGEGAAFGRKFLRQCWENYTRSIHCNLETNSSFPLVPRKIMGNLDRVGRSQDLPGGYWVLATNSVFK